MVAVAPGRSSLLLAPPAMGDSSVSVSSKGLRGACVHPKMTGPAAAPAAAAAGGRTRRDRVGGVVGGMWWWWSWWCGGCWVMLSSKGLVLVVLPVLVGWGGDGGEGGRGRRVGTGGRWGLLVAGGCGGGMGSGMGRGSVRIAMTGAASSWACASGGGGRAAASEPAGSITSRRSMAGAAWVDLIDRSIWRLLSP